MALQALHEKSAVLAERIWKLMNWLERGVDERVSSTGVSSERPML